MQPQYITLLLMLSYLNRKLPSNCSGNGYLSTHFHPSNQKIHKNHIKLTSGTSKFHLYTTQTF